MIDVMLLCLSLFLFSLSMLKLKEFILPVISFIQLKRNKVVEEEQVEEEYEVYEPKYDVSAYKKRMEYLRANIDEEGLFEFPVVSPKTDFTGTEVISDEYEKEIE